jgi:hypothetical protein
MMSKGFSVIRGLKANVTLSHAGSISGTLAYNISNFSPMLVVNASIAFE